jgi:Transcription factor WhiB
MHKHEWKDQGACVGYDTNLFFDKYEENETLRPAIDKVCSGCPVARDCFAVGVSQKEWGVWGGIFLESGKISREFNSHRTKKDWGNKWKDLTTDE